MNATTHQHISWEEAHQNVNTGGDLQGDDPVPEMLKKWDVRYYDHTSHEDRTPGFAGDRVPPAEKLKEDKWRLDDFPSCRSA